MQDVIELNQQIEKQEKKNTPIYSVVFDFLKGYPPFYETDVCLFLKLQKHGSVENA